MTEDVRPNQLVFEGDENRLQRVDLLQGVSLESELAQLQFLHLCRRMHDKSVPSPIHSKETPVCLYMELEHFVTSNQSAIYGSYPIPEPIFPAVLQEFLAPPVRYYYRTTVGFRSEPGQTHHLAWFHVGVRSQFGLLLVEQLSNPDILEACERCARANPGHCARMCTPVCCARVHCVPAVLRGSVLRERPGVAMRTPHRLGVSTSGPRRER